MSCVRVLAAGILSLSLTGCASSSISLNRDYDDPMQSREQFEAQSPEAFEERFGPPDEWKNKSAEEDHPLEMTAIWKCLDGQYREVTWRMQDSQKGVRHWVVVSDTSRKGDCGKAGTS
jgi:hypothetical protein